MITYNVSAGKAYYSQRNNEIKPFESCNVTSMVMALDYLGYDFPEGNYSQPEDRLRFFIENDPGCLKVYDDFCKSNSWAKGIPAVQLHDVLSAGVNLWMGKKVTSFSWARKINDIFQEIKNGKPVVLSGDFPGYPTKKPKPLGHIVTLVGANWQTSDDENPISIIVDDPYGNTMNDWQGSGNDIIIPWELFISWIKPVNDKNVKWGHFFEKV